MNVCTNALPKSYVIRFVVYQCTCVHMLNMKKYMKKQAHINIQYHAYKLAPVYNSTNTEDVILFGAKDPLVK